MGLGKTEMGKTWSDRQTDRLIEWCKCRFNIISVTSERPVHLSMLFWSSIKTDGATL